MPDDQKLDAWMQRVLGVSLPKKAFKPVRFSPVPANIERPSGKDILLGKNRPRSERAIAALPPKPQHFVAKDGRKLAVTPLPNGTKIFTAPPPPVTEITFSGGGGKGIALPGAVRALHDSGVLNDAKCIAGASVGSMTAALVAAGISADEFQRVAEDDATTHAITEGTGGTLGGMAFASVKNLVTTGSANPFTGDGLENIVRGVLNDTLRKRMGEHVRQSQQAGTAPSPVVISVAKQMRTLGTGPTFSHLRQLSAVIPAVKEVLITGTYVTEFEVNEDGELKKVKGGNTEAKLYVFSADSEPDLEVAVAVHASASFPMVFKPVDIKLSSGKTVRFIDGGVMNNTPTSASLAGVGDEMDRSMLDPVPAGRGMTFVFEDDQTAQLQQGIATPSQGLGARLQDWLLGANNAGAEYAKNLSAASKPQELIVVPLRVKLPAEGDEEALDVDMTGLLGGTLKFQVEPRVALALQEATEEATLAQVRREQGPKSRQFKSDAQMFVSISLAELLTLADSDYPGADDALAFRAQVAQKLQALQQAVAAAPEADDDVADGASPLLSEPVVTADLQALGALAGGDIDFQGYIAREMNRGGLDGLLAALRRHPPPQDVPGLHAVLKAGFAVADALRAHDHAERLLKQLVYPKMKTERKGGSGIEVLLAVQAILRSAVKPIDVNEAIDMAIEHFQNKSDRIIFMRRGHKAFAKALAGWRMNTTA